MLIFPIFVNFRRWRLDDLYLGDCGAHVAWCDGGDCRRVVCEGSRIGNGAPWCDADTQVPRDRMCKHRMKRKPSKLGNWLSLKILRADF